MVNIKKKNERRDTGKGPIDRKSVDKQKFGERKSITDSRFESVHSDPRFQNVPTNKSKVHIDSRFSSAFSDKRFNTFHAPCDKRGRPKNKNKSDSNPLKDYYHLETEEDEAKSQDHDVSDESIDADTFGSKDSGESSDTSDDDDSVDIESEDEEDVENVPVIDKSTRRLAVVNLDWQNIKAVDLFVLMKSALREGEQILSVDVYPTEFGIKCMQEEEARGPAALLGPKNSKNDETDDDDSSGDENDNENSVDKIGDGNISEENDDENTIEEVDNDNSSDGFDDESSGGEFDDEDSSNEIDDESIREYEKSKLRYYCAVVVCDSISTAENLYKTLDGVEIGRSSNKFDLRVIEDSVEFTHPPRETATEVPADYEGLNFCTRVLQLTKVESTYDEEDEPQREKKLKRCFNDDQLAEIGKQEYLASSDDSEDEHGDVTEPQCDKKQKMIDKYRALLSGNVDNGEDGNEDMDMEVTFNTGLEDISKRVLEKKDKLSETLWEKHLREREEKKKARKNKSRHSSSYDESSDDYEISKEKNQEQDDFFVEPTAVVKKGKSSTKVNENDKEGEASRAELELLLADDKGEKKVKGYNLKAKKPKGKKDKEVSNVNNIPDTDYDDPRFAALFKSAPYALDPTDPQFKRSAAYARQLELKQRQTEPEIPSDDLEMNKKKKAKVEELPSQEKHELSALLKSIKMKAKQDWLPSNNKNARKDGSSTLIKRKSKKVMF